MISLTLVKDVCFENPFKTVFVVDWLLDLLALLAVDEVLILRSEDEKETRDSEAVRLEKTVIVLDFGRRVLGAGAVG